MEQYVQPKIHDDFIQTTETERDSIRDQVNSLFPEKNITFNSVWGIPKFKKVFVKAQYNKCAYCEEKLTTHPDVEHFFPKGLVKKLHSTGYEVTDMVNMRGQQGSIIACNGFWWLAYNWYNYLLSCSICNRQWKVNFFEFKPNRDSALLVNNKSFVRRRKKYIPQLLHPFKGPTPYKHLKYNKYGFISARNKSILGINSINVYGLHRATLTDSREEKMANIYNAVLKYITAIQHGDDLGIQKSVVTLFKLGHKSRPFSSIVKSVLFDQVELSWESFMKINKNTFEIVNIELDTIVETKRYVQYLQSGTVLEIADQAQKIKQMGAPTMPHFSLVQFFFTDVSNESWATL
ncbi:hypothetical protein [Sulfurovum sp.]|uniref:hypothetical protein n=1 Tax=Sulfurovum sp. TaxID=1969726 RepID=UPI003567F96E